MGDPAEVVGVLLLRDKLLAAGDTDAADVAQERAHELLYAEGLTTVAFDPEDDAWHFGHERAGPAGAATLRLADGAILSVDLAEPSRLVALTVAQLSASARATVAAIVGEQAAAMLDVAEEHLGWELVPLAARGRALAALGRLAVLERLRAADEADNGAWPLWAAEAAVVWDRAAIPGSAVRARAEAATCAQTVLAVAESTGDADVRRRLGELIAPLKALTAGRDRALLERAEQALLADRPGPSRSWREAIAAMLRRTIEIAVPTDESLMWAATARGEVPRGRQPDSPSATLPLGPYHHEHGLAGTRARVYWTAGSGELAVRCDATAEGADHVGALWVRAFEAPGFVFLGSAPLALDPAPKRSDGGVATAVARLDVPPQLKRDLIYLDITARPAEPPAASRLGLIRRALAAGEAAAAAERAELFEDAAEHWARSADLWLEASDVRQHAYAEIHRARTLDRAGDAGAADVRAAVADVRAPYAWRMAHEPDPVEPCIAELVDADEIP